MPFPLNPTAGQQYTNTGNGRSYVFKECSPGVGYWDLDASKMLAHSFEDWDVTKQYGLGDFVMHQHGLYEARVPNVGNEPRLWHDYAHVVTDPNWVYVGVIPQIVQGDVKPNSDHYIKFEATTIPPEGVFTLKTINKPIDDWDGTIKYHEKDIVIYHHGLYESLIDTNDNNTPTKHLSDANWEFKGYLPKPATQPQDGEGIIWNAGLDSFEFSTSSGTKTASTIVRNVQQGSFALPSKPTKYWKLSGNFSTSNAGVAQFRGPMFVGQSNSAWINAGDGASGVFNFAQAHNSQGGQNNGWNDDLEVKGAFTINTAGWSLCPQQGQWSFRESKQFRLTMEAHRAASATEEWWVIHWDVMGAMWGNKTGHVSGAYWGRAAVWDNLTTVGIKMSNYTADMFLVCEYF